MFQIPACFFLLFATQGFSCPCLGFVLINYCHLIPRNHADDAWARWVAVSRDNVYIVRKKRKSGCRFSCQDIGETRKNIPIANIQDVMITEPAGTAVCCFIQNVLTDVQIQTAAGGGGGDPRMDSAMGYLRGLEDPKRFRDVVMNLKKGRYVDRNGQPSAFTPVADALSGAVHGIGGTVAAGGAMAAGLGAAAMAGVGGGANSGEVVLELK